MARKSKFVEVLLCCWMIAAQVWYYAQFKDQFAGLLRSAAGPLLRRLWP